MMRRRASAWPAACLLVVLCIAGVSAVAEEDEAAHPAPFSPGTAQCYLGETASSLYVFGDNLSSSWQLVAADMTTGAVGSADVNFNAGSLTPTFSQMYALGMNASYHQFAAVDMAGNPSLVRFADATPTTHEFRAATDYSGCDWSGQVAAAMTQPGTPYVWMLSTDVPAVVVRIDTSGSWSGTVASPLFECWTTVGLTEPMGHDLDVQDAVMLDDNLFVISKGTGMSHVIARLMIDDADESPPFLPMGETLDDLVPVPGTLRGDESRKRFAFAATHVGKSSDVVHVVYGTAGELVDANPDEGPSVTLQAESVVTTAWIDEAGGMYYFASWTNNTAIGEPSSRLASTFFASTGERGHVGTDLLRDARPALDCAVYDPTALRAYSSSVDNAQLLVVFPIAGAGGSDDGCTAPVNDQCTKCFQSDHCGWCHASDQCMRGSTDGPATGSCPAGEFTRDADSVPECEVPVTVVPFNPTVIIVLSVVAGLLVVAGGAFGFVAYSKSDKQAASIIAAERKERDAARKKRGGYTKLANEPDTTVVHKGGASGGTGGAKKRKRSSSRSSGKRRSSKDGKRRHSKGSKGSRDGKKKS